MSLPAASKLVLTKHHLDNNNCIQTSTEREREKERENYLKWLIECRGTDGKQIGLGDHTAMEKKSQPRSRAIRNDNKWNIKCIICIVWVYLNTCYYGTLMSHEDIQVSLTFKLSCLHIKFEGLFNKWWNCSQSLLVLCLIFRHIQIVLEIIEYFKIYGQTIKQWKSSMECYFSLICTTIQ